MPVSDTSSERFPRAAAMGSQTGSSHIPQGLFAPCDRYAPDQDLELEVIEGPSCVECIWQYLPGHVCPEFQERLLKAAGLERGDGEHLETPLR